MYMLHITINKHIFVFLIKKIVVVAIGLYGIWFSLLTLLDSTVYG